MRVIERLAWRIQCVIEQTLEGLKRFFFDVILTWRKEWETTAKPLIFFGGCNFRKAKT